MSVPLVAAGVGLLTNFIKKGGLKKVGGFVGGLFKKRNKKDNNNANSGSLLFQPGPVGQTSYPPASLVPNPDKKDAADVVNDWLGRATKDTRNVQTGLDDKTMIFGAAAVLALLLFMKK